jgi:hypothetical protein
MIKPEDFIMTKSKLAMGVLLIAGLVGSPLVADAKSHTKHSKHSSMTTGSSMKSDKGTTANPSSRSNAGANTGNSTTGPAAAGK